MTVILIAPQGSGKTRNAETLKQMFGCTAVIEEWDSVSELPPHALALTHALPKALGARELATVLAALRYWQEARDVPPGIYDIAAEAGEPLSDAEIDALCARLNT